jgi:ribonuclease T2
MQNTSAMHSFLKHRPPKIAHSILRRPLTLGSAVAQSLHQNEPGNFDYYILSLSWSPSFCETAIGGARQQQCGKRSYAFVVHGLWPQYVKGFPEACQVPAPRLDRRIVNNMLDLIPAPGLIFHEWDAHGTCSGLRPRDYFDTVRKARAIVTIPSEYLNPGAALTVTPHEVVDNFVKANEGLPPAAIEIDCDRTRLREVRICLTRELAFRDCTGRRPVCRSEQVVMPPARGQ